MNLLVGIWKYVNIFTVITPTSSVHKQCYLRTNLAVLKTAKVARHKIGSSKTSWSHTVDFLLETYVLVTIYFKERGMRYRTKNFFKKKQSNITVESNALNAFCKFRMSFIACIHESCVLWKNNLYLLFCHQSCIY